MTERRKKTTPNKKVIPSRFTLRIYLKLICLSIFFLTMSVSFHIFLPCCLYTRTFCWFDNFFAKLYIDKNAYNILSYPFYILLNWMDLEIEIIWGYVKVFPVIIKSKFLYSIVEKLNRSYLYVNDYIKCVFLLYRKSFILCI